MSAALSLAQGNAPARRVADVLRDEGPTELARLHMEREQLAVRLRDVQTRIGWLELHLAVAGEPEA